MATKEDKAWIAKMQKLLNACPNKNWGFYTIGDSEVTVYDRRALIASGHYDENEDLVGNINKAECDGEEIEVARLKFPVNVEGVCG